MHAPERYRLKALACESMASEATDPAIKIAWAEIAIEWHALANRTAEEENGTRTSTFSAISVATLGNRFIKK